MILRRFVVVVLYLVAAVALFVFLHGGANGERACTNQGFSGPGTVSWWPPGTLCQGYITEVRLDPAYFVLLFAAVWPALTFCLLACRRSIRRRRQSELSR